MANSHLCLSQPPKQAHSSETLAEPLSPFLKWPGGKRWAAQQIAEVIRRKLLGAYWEPFLGGGAIFFLLRPSRAILSDVNPDLMNTYRVVRDSPDEVIRVLDGFRVSKKTYYRIRASVPPDRVVRAARFLYLNRTAFGGMYRLNRQGGFNVPYGGGDRTPNILLQTGLLKNSSNALQSAELKESDFEVALKSAKTGDVVYCDPTYTVTHDHNGFVRYNEQNFSWTDQERLARAAVQARRRGVSIIVSNAHHEEIKKLYQFATLRTLTRQSTLSADPLKRRTVHEYLIIL